ncbi:hypothetical protein ACPXCE_09125 [Streptomyces sp. DT24]
MLKEADETIEQLAIDETAADGMPLNAVLTTRVLLRKDVLTRCVLLWGDE